MVQRLLTAESGKKGGVALALSGLVNVPVVLLFLSIGTGLAALHAVGIFHPTDAFAAFPEFVRDRMSAPWSGLVLAGLVRGSDVEPRLGHLRDRSDVGGRSRRASRGNER